MDFLQVYDIVQQQNAKCTLILMTLNPKAKQIFQVKKDRRTYFTTGMQSIKVVSSKYTMN